METNDSISAEPSVQRIDPLWNVSTGYLAMYTIGIIIIIINRL